MASRVSSTREETPTFSKTCLRWVATVYVDRKRRSPA